MDSSSGFGFRFYNAGKRISENFRFSISESSQGIGGGMSTNDKQAVGFWSLEAPEKDWFFVPVEIPSGNEVVRVNFKRDISLKFGERGVVLLDASHNPETEDPDKSYAMAPTEEAVIERAEQLWNSYTLAVIDRHLADSDQALAAGGRPRKASGFTKFCFKLHNKIDPGDTFAHTENVSKAGDNGLQSQMSMLTALVVALASGQKLEPEALKALLNTAPAPGETGKPVTSGIATGQIKKPVDGPDGWTKGSGNLDKGTLREKEAAKGKQDRTKEAVGAL